MAARASDTGRSPLPAPRGALARSRGGGGVGRSLRHTAITQALDEDEALRRVQVFMGHRDPRNTTRYDHLPYGWAGPPGSVAGG